MAVRRLATRHAPTVALAVLVLSLAGTAAALVAARALAPTPHVDAGDLIYVACQILPYGVVGAILVARRPDLPFGWLLSLAAMALVAMLVVAGSAIVALEHGRGGQLAVWGLSAGSLLFVPAALEGMINVRFPSGSPASRWGRRLDRAIAAGVLLALVGGVLGDSVGARDLPRRATRRQHPLRGRDPSDRDRQPGGRGRPGRDPAGCDRGGRRRRPLPQVRRRGASAAQWRAVGVVAALLLFPFAVTETLPDVVGDVEPLLFVATLLVPVLRYDLWAIDSIIRRSAVSTFASPATVVDNMVRATAEMLHLPYVAVRHRDLVLASHGQATGPVESWPLAHDGEQVGELVAAPRHGFSSFSEPDRRILAMLAQMVGGSVRAEALTADLLDARHRLVTAREEERRRLRRDLHDGLGPLLTGLGLNLDAAAAQLTHSEAKTAAYLANAREASGQVIASLREVVDGLRPPTLDELGLAGALRLHLEGLATDAGLALDLRVPEHMALPAAVEVAAFRTVVEAVTNVARHGGARRVWVELDEQPDALTVTVRDDGPARASWTPGVGLDRDARTRRGARWNLRCRPHP